MERERSRSGLGGEVGNGSARPSDTRLVAFVPTLTVDMARKGDGNLHESVEGSMLSADISGFTALSESLADKGREGAEELTRLINSCFVALMDAAYGYGGEVLKFGGDAVLLMFRGDDHLRRAGRAAQAMQLVLRQTSAARRADLTMTVGVAEGPFDVFLVGSNERELLVSGAAASEVIRLEASASHGETLASDRIAAALSDRRHHGATVIWDQPTTPASRTVGDADLSPYVPATVAEQLGAFSDVGGEHRLVAIGFVAIGGVDQAIEALGGGQVADDLGALFDDIQRACRRYSVTALHSDIAPDGLKLVLSAGAPQATATPGDAMLKATLEIAMATSPFTIKQGVQVGRVFAGFLGSEYRRTYTLMGDPVNTAARMLGKAADRDVIAVHDVVLETRSVFIEEELEPFLVKGKSAPIVAHRILASTDEVRRRGDWIPFVGRADELAVLERSVSSGGTAIDIAGAGGSGKTRLVEESGAMIERSGYLRFQAVCSPYGGTAPYSLMRNLIRNGLGVDMHLDDESTGELLTKVVRQFAPELSPVVPLLATAIGASVESTPEFEALAPEHRRDRLHEAMVRFLDEAFDRPIAFVAEDVHWVDDASRDLLAHIADQIKTKSWLVITTRRSEGRAEPEAGAATSSHRITMELGPIDDDAMRTIVLGNATLALSDQQVATVIERAAGNPLFAVELARIVTNGSADHLPDSVEKIVSARLDLLPPDARRFLRIASVIGVEMNEPDLLGILAAEAPGLTPPWDDVAEFFTPRPDGTAAFANIVSHDAAYEGLPFGTRRRIHRAVGEYLERKNDAAEYIAPLLALHFSEARDHRKAWAYGQLAGASAAREQANVEAAANFGRALASARYVRKLPAPEIVDVAMQLGEARLVLGQFDEARTAWQYARKRNSDLAVECSIMRSLGIVEERMGSIDNALKWYERSDAHAAGDTSDTVAVERARTFVARAGVLIRKAQNGEALEAANTALALLASHDAPEVTANALDRLQLASSQLRDPESDRFGIEALALFEQTGNFAGMARVLNNMGIAAYFQGDWDAAATHYADSVDYGLRAGALVDGMLGALNAGEVLSDQGRWDEAAEQLESALRNWESAGYAVGIAAAKLFLSVLLRRKGEWTSARTALDEAIASLEDLGIAELIDDAKTRECELDVYSGKPDRERLTALIARLGLDHPLSSRLQRLDALVSALEGRSDSAAEALDVLLDSVSDFERLLTLRATVHVTPNDERAPQWVAEAEEIAALLGVVQTAQLPTIKS